MSDTPPHAPETPPTRRCPECGRPASRAHRPFCSKRCADLDLGRWFTEEYRVPTDEPAPTAGRGDDDAEP